MYKTITIIMSLASLVKAAVSMAVALDYVAKHNHVYYYFIAESIVWACCFAFFAVYASKLKTKADLKKEMKIR